MYINIYKLTGLAGYYISSLMHLTAKRLSRWRLVFKRNDTAYTECAYKYSVFMYAFICLNATIYMCACVYVFKI